MSALTNTTHVFCSVCAAHLEATKFSKSQLKAVRRGDPGKCKTCAAQSTKSSPATHAGLASKVLPALPDGPPAKAEEGFALTMHQPWASLLVAGIKRIEGRSWGAGATGSQSFSHGMLWIHAAAKEPSAEEIAAVEDQYRVLYRLDGIPDDQLTFPTAYPTSALLGCVDVAAILPLEEMQGIPGLSESQRFESESEYVFLCQNPMRLLLPRRMGGEHKIWQLSGAKKAAAGLLPSITAPPLQRSTDFRALLRK